MTAKTIVRWYGNLFNRRISQQLQSDDRSKLHRNHLLVSFQGRKSGRRYTIPVNYCTASNGNYAISTEANWRHNFAEPIQVELQVAGKRISGVGRQVVDDPENRQRLGRKLAGWGWFLFSRSLTIIEITPETDSYQS